MSWNSRASEKKSQSTILQTYAHTTHAYHSRSLPVGTSWASGLQSRHLCWRRRFSCSLVWIGFSRSLWSRRRSPGSDGSRCWSPRQTAARGSYLQGGICTVFIFIILKTTPTVMQLLKLYTSEDREQLRVEKYPVIFVFVQNDVIRQMLMQLLWQYCITVLICQLLQDNKVETSFTQQYAGIHNLYDLRPPFLCSHPLYPPFLLTLGMILHPAVDLLCHSCWFTEVNGLHFGPEILSHQM